MSSRANMLTKPQLDTFMSNNSPCIHPQLLADCHLLGQLDTGSLLLSRNSHIHWFILVPTTTQADLLDLPADELTQVMSDATAISNLLKQQLAYPKINFASLGNVVPQMHLHIIGRRPEDICWPQPVWGQLPDSKPWSQQARKTLLDMLVQNLRLRPSKA